MQGDGTGQGGKGTPRHLPQGASDFARGSPGAGNQESCHLAPEGTMTAPVNSAEREVRPSTCAFSHVVQVGGDETGFVGDVSAWPDERFQGSAKHHSKQQRDNNLYCKSKHGEGLTN